MTVHAVPHRNTWRLIDSAAPEHGDAVLVQMGNADRPYLWFLCPAAATLHIGQHIDLRDCSDGSCQHADMHLAAANLWQIMGDEHANARALAEQIIRHATDAAVQGSMTGEPTGLLAGFAREPLMPGEQVASADEVRGLGRSSPGTAVPSSAMPTGDAFLAHYSTPELLSDPDS